MSYREARIDRQNARWFKSDNTCATLRAIKLRVGHLRGLYPFEIEFAYPISALAGENGSGKSTILAMTACAFHNRKKGYKPLDRAKNYYTFSDFLIQAVGEMSPDGITIGYKIVHNNWRGREPGPAWQSQKKRIGGKWTNYDRRVPRNVLYFGIERVVPPNERSAHRSYRHRFTPAELNDQTRRKICQIVGRIIGKTYDDFSLHEHSKYRLTMVNSGNIQYSGFNMGAGECAVFNMLVSLFEADHGALLVVDEIELGLHEKAQKRLIQELKILCNELHCQVICSTHSSVILENLPPHARFFVETHGGNTNVMQGISPRYASGKLGGRSSEELSIFVEDDIGEAVLMEIMPLNRRERTRLFPIGSLDAVLRQIAARYRERREDCIAFLDGDKRAEHNLSVTKIKNYLETRFRCTEGEMDEWINARLHYLPGNTWPEKWLIKQARAQDDITALGSVWRTDISRLSDILDEAVRAEKHDEFFELSKSLHLSKDLIQSDIIRFVCEQASEEFAEVIESIKNSLE